MFRFHVSFQYFERTITFWANATLNTLQLTLRFFSLFPLHANRDISCPNGHQQHWPQETDLEKERRKSQMLADQR